MSSRRVSVDPLDLNVAERRALTQLHVPELAELENGQEVHDDLDAGA